MDHLLWEEISSGLPSTRQLVQVVIRLLAATLLGAAIGFERKKARKPGGVRTHALVCLGTTVLVLSCWQVGMELEDISRVLQGIITGIGFLGGGTILKLSQEKDIQGLTSAASVWMTAAIGLSVGLGAIGIALLSTGLALLILTLTGRFENRSPGHGDR
ncbi:MgtC/SapB family protein [Larkinella soli]|uniref:MgtC/SapB family protein n=1 Tax=Larkinella soli TaxID=1770527 RepID=UPI000FFB49B3|nr:MgtC/SapB family protein [Larkinella soli]